MKTNSEFFDNSKVPLILLVIFSFVIRYVGADDYSLWFDEALNFRIASQPWGILWLTNFDPTPPLYYSMLKLFLSYESSEALIRLPSIICGSLTVLVFYKICRTEFSQSISLFTSLLFSLSCHQLEYSQEARAYAMQLFFGLSAFYFAYVSVINKYENNSIAIALYGLFATLSLYTHNIAVFYILGINLFVFYTCIANREFKKLKVWVICNALVFCIWLPWPLVTVFSGEENSFQWLKHVSPLQFLISTIKSIKLSPDPRNLSIIDGLFVLSVLTGALFAFKKRNKLLLVSIILLALSSVFLVWVTGYFQPIFMARTILVSSVIAYLLLPYFLERLSKYAKYGALLVLISCHLYYYVNYTQNRYSEDEQWSQAIDYLQSENFEKILICSTSPSWAISYYLDTNSVSAYVVNSNIDGVVKVDTNLKNKIKAVEAGMDGNSEILPLNTIDNAIFIDSHCTSSKKALLSEVIGLQALKTNEFKKIDLYRIVF